MALKQEDFVYVGRPDNRGYSMAVRKNGGTKWLTRNQTRGWRIGRSKLSTAYEYIFLI